MGDIEGRWVGEEASDRSQFHLLHEFTNILKMGTEYSSETLINLFQTTQQFIQEDIH
jgi:hypothetical protein